MELIINNMSQYGVLVHGPESRGYRERLITCFRESLLPKKPELDDDELQYSFIVENQTQSEIVEIRFICSPDPRESGPPFQMAHGNSSGRLFGDKWDCILKPGGQCPWSLLDGYWFLNRNTVYASVGERLREQREQLKKRLESIDKWSLEIDKVLSSDGSYVGPDYEFEFDRIEALHKGSQEMIVELNRKLDAGDDAFKYAEQCASITMDRIKELYPDPRLYPRSPEIIYLWERKIMAKGFLLQWYALGKQALIEQIRQRAFTRNLESELFRRDISKMDEEAKVRFRASTDLIDELIQKLDEGEDIFALIDGYASTSRSQIEALYPDARTISPNLEHVYAVSKKAMGMTIIKLRERLGEAATVELIRERVNSQIPLIRR